MWLEAHNLNLVLPEVWFGVPHCFADEFCLVTPISRVPTFSQFSTLDHIPSLLDYCASSKDTVLSSSLEWDNRISDHAWSVLHLNCRTAVRKFPKTRWICRDLPQFKHACSSLLLSRARPVDPNSFLSSFKAVICDFNDKTDCKTRHFQRMPMQLRSLYSELARCSDPLVKERMHSECLAQRKLWLRNLHIASLKSTVDAGQVFSRSKKLHHVSALILEDGVCCDGSERICTEAAKYFGLKLGNSDLHKRSVARDFVASMEGLRPSFTEMDVDVCLGRLRKKNKLDSHGCCVDALSIYFAQDREGFTTWLQDLCSSTSSMSKLVCRGRFWGKSSSRSELSKLRAIFPQHALLALIDCVLSRCLEHAIDKILLVTPGLFFGGHKHTQSLDISHAASLVIEHGLDCWGEGAWAQMDIRSYYDELPILDIARFLLSHGGHKADVASAVRHQLFVSLEFEFQGHTAGIPARSRGGLTGSRIASLLQRMPVEHSLLHCHEALRPCGLRCGPARLCAASYIDNLYFPSRFGSSATTNAELVEAHLKTVWGLSIKNGSKKVVLSRGQIDDDLVEDGWVVEDTSGILGRFVSADNSI